MTKPHEGGMLACRACSESGVVPYMGATAKCPVCKGTGEIKDRRSKPGRRRPAPSAAPGGPSLRDRVDDIIQKHPTAIPSPELLSDRFYALCTDLASPPPAIPEGWQVVPKEPTTEMRIAGAARCLEGVSGDVGELSGACYAAMLSATPTPPVAPWNAIEQREIDIGILLDAIEDLEMPTVGEIRDPVSVAAVKQRWTERRALTQPDAAPDDIIAWLQTLPQTAAPELRKVYEFYKAHYEQPDAVGVGEDQVERVAIALWSDQTVADDFDWKHQSATTQIKYRRQARTALRALPAPMSGEDKNG